MTRVVQFPLPQPEKFGFHPVRKRTPARVSSQLDLFAEAKVVRLGRMGAFEEALMLDERNDARARAAYLKAIEANDCRTDAYCNLGILEFTNNQASQAIDYFTRCLVEDPRHFEAHYNLANVYAELGNLPLAKAHYEMAAALEPDYANSHFNLALTLALLNDLAGARCELASYIALTPPEDHAVANQLMRALEHSVQP